MNHKNRNIKNNDFGIRRNADVRHDEVRLLKSDRKTLIGLMNSRDAFNKAKDEGLDLIELAPKAKPPVCFIGDYSKYIFELKKKEKDNKKKNKAIAMKTIKIGPNSAEADSLRQIKHADEFLEAGHRVTISVQFRGRQCARINEMSESISAMVLEHIENGKLDSKPNKTNNMFRMLLVPLVESDKADVTEK